MKIGLALAGGGLQAFAHIGAIQALNESGIKIDYISGTSSGSLIAALYALGYSTQEMQEIFVKYYKEIVKIETGKILWIAKDYFLKKEINTEGLIDGSKIEELFNEITNNKNISETKIPLAIPTVDTISTKECIFLSQKYDLVDNEIDYIYDVPLAKAVRASMAFPGILTTCSLGKYNFIDGGTKDNLPVKVLKDMGADYTIGISFDISNYEPSNNLLKVALRAVDIFSQKDVKNAQKIADIAIEIDTKNASLLELGDIKQCISTGYDAVKKHLESIKI